VLTTNTHTKKGLREGGRQAGRRLQRTRRKKQCSKYSKCCSTRNVVKINGWWWVVGGGWQVVATWQRDNDCDDDCADLRACVQRAASPPRQDQLGLPSLLPAVAMGGPRMGWLRTVCVCVRRGSKTAPHTLTNSNSHSYRLTFTVSMTCLLSLLPPLVSHSHHVPGMVCCVMQVEVGDA